MLDFDPYLRCISLLHLRHVQVPNDPLDRVSLILPAYEEEISSRSARSLTLRPLERLRRLEELLSPYVLPSVGVSGDTENRPPARSRRYLIQKTVRPFCPSPTFAKVRCFLSSVAQGLISEGRKYFTVARMHSRLSDHRSSIDVLFLTL